MINSLFTIHNSHPNPSTDTTQCSFFPQVQIPLSADSSLTSSIPPYQFQNIKNLHLLCKHKHQLCSTLSQRCFLKCMSLIYDVNKCIHWNYFSVWTTGLWEWVFFFMLSGIEQPTNNEVTNLFDWLWLVHNPELFSNNHWGALSLNIFLTLLPVSPSPILSNVLK